MLVFGFIFTGQVASSANQFHLPNFTIYAAVVYVLGVDRYNSYIYNHAMSLTIFKVFVVDLKLLVMSVIFSPLIREMCLPFPLMCF